MCARLGWTLLRPIGMDWFDEGYWNFERAWHGAAVAKQYLAPWSDDLTQWPTRPATGKASMRLTNEPPWKGHTLRLDKSHGRFQNLVTLEAMREDPPDIVMASVAHNHEGMARFAREVGAKFGLHLGNVRFSEIDSREDRWDLADFGILTSILPITPPVPHVVVHQEFSLEDFRHESAVFLNGPRMRVSSFVNCFPENTEAYGGWKVVAASRPQYDWRVYGAYGSVPEDEWAAGNL